ncbi:hypothetical protein MFIFM68171_02091 [Madurella fahalii]|uniref:Uncharacterized protein n=1 Tax=Madurella fahalii TaxID=1157608 RepID=A0ABQ0G291_9PEZI
MDPAWWKTNVPGRLVLAWPVSPGRTMARTKSADFEGFGASPIGKRHEHGVGLAAYHGRVALCLRQLSELAEAGEYMAFRGLLDKMTPVLEGEGPEGSGGHFVGEKGVGGYGLVLHLNTSFRLRQ